MNLTHPAAAVPGPSPVPPPEGPAAHPKPVLRIRPRSGWQAIDLRELWRYRELLWLLGLRDVQVRYKQTLLGVAWAVIQPLFTMLVFTLFFGKLAHIESEVPGEIPYAVYTMCALLPWQLFAFALAQGSNSVVTSRGLITKVYFPRLLVPMAPLLCGLLDFAISLGLLGALMAWYRVTPSGWPVLTLPLFVLLAVACSLAVSLWLSALNAVYRDVQFTLGFLTQLWLFATPVAYPSSLAGRWRWLFGFNPMAGVVDGFRWALLGGAEPPGPMLLVSVVTVAVLLVSGLFFFRRMEKTFADLV
jgi:lipopolysaccharide transport system permease protein